MSQAINLTTSESSSQRGLSRDPSPNQSPSIALHHCPVLLTDLVYMYTDLILDLWLSLLPLAPHHWPGSSVRAGILPVLFIVASPGLAQRKHPLNWGQTEWGAQCPAYGRCYRDGDQYGQTPGRLRGEEPNAGLEQVFGTCCVDSGESLPLEVSVPSSVR